MNLRNEIKEMLKTHLPIGKVIASREELDEPLTKIVNLQANKVLDEATSQILSLLEGITNTEVKYPELDEYVKLVKNSNHDEMYEAGWLACLQEIRSKINE